MSWAKDHKWNPKKHNMNKRVNAYSIPGVNEARFKDESKRNKKWWQFWK